MLESRQTHSYKIGDVCMIVDVPQMNKLLVWRELKPVRIKDVRGEFICVVALDNTPIAMFESGTRTWPTRHVWLNPQHIMLLDDMPLEAAPSS